MQRFTPASVDTVDTVLRAFGARGPARPLAGGQGTSWFADGLVFKPEAGPLQEWLGETLPRDGRDGFRLAEQVRARDGSWSHDGWSATRRVEGAAPDYTDVRTWAAIIAAGRAFHHAVAGLERPQFLGSRRDRWARADRVAWGEEDIGFIPRFASLATVLRRALDPADHREPSQIVHADLAGNVLFAPGLPPAVIDVSPYWRPVSFAEGMVVADALCWHDAPLSLPSRLGVPRSALARALLFRMTTTSLRAADLDDAAIRDEADRYRRAATALAH